MAAQEQSDQKLPVLKLRQELASIEKAFATINTQLKVSNLQSADFEENIKSAQDAASKFNLNTVEKSLNDIGRALNLPEKALNRFIEKQTEAFKNQATQSFTQNMREIQMLLGLSNDEMRMFAKRYGELGAKFEPKSDLERWLDDRMQSLAKGSDDKLTGFYDKTIPDSLGKASDAFADLFTGIVKGTKHSSELFSDLGKSIRNIAEEIATDLMKVGMRFMLFGSEKSGSKGLLGGLADFVGPKLGSLVDIISGWFSGDEMSAKNFINWGFTLGSFFPFAHGNAFSNLPALAAYSNAVVTRPTVFPFAHGIGLMGEKPGSPGEAIMPLDRNSRGDLSVNVTGITGSGNRGKVTVNLIDQRGVSAPPVEVQQTPTANGGMNISVLIKAEMQKAFASGSMDGIMSGRYGSRVQPRRR